MRSRRRRLYQLEKQPRSWKRKILLTAGILVGCYIGLLIIAGALLLVNGARQKNKSLSSPTSATTAPGSQINSNTSLQSNADPAQAQQTQKKLNNILSQVGSSSSFNPYSVDLTNPLNSSIYDELSSPTLSKNKYCTFGCNIYDSSGHYITLTCSSYINSCTANNSAGGSLNITCSNYINSCSSYGSDGSYYNTTCSNYINSCNTYGSNGYSSNTSCSNYISSCNTYDSNGNTYNTTCSTYINTCNTYGSNGYSSTTNCSAYISSCDTYQYGGL